MSILNYFSEREIPNGKFQKNILETIDWERKRR